MEQIKEKSFTIDDLKPFDKVLVRNSKFQEWSTGIFSHVRRYSTEIKKAIIVGGREEDYCIPYNNETKKLLGTIEEYNGKYKTW